MDARGARTERTYDAVGRLIATKMADGGTTGYAYCADEPGSAPCEVVDPMGRVTKMTYDALGRQSSVTDALGDTSTTTYDNMGRRSAVTGPNGHTTRYTYDHDGRLHQVMSPLSSFTAQVTYGYDARGNRTKVTDGLGHATTFTYDLANHLLTETTPIGTTTSYTYDPTGNRATRTDASSRTTTYTYDPNHELLEKHFADGVVHTFKYDSRGNRTYEEDPAVARTRVYDAISRLKSVTDHALNKTIDYRYDANGNRTKLTWDGKVIRYQYDQMNRLVEVVDPEGGIARLTYDRSGKRTSLTYANGILASYRYDGAGRLTDIVYTKPDGTVVESFHYDLDRAGNRLTKGFADGTREVYTYDAANRLTGVTYGDGRHVDYNLDLVGNRQALRETNPDGSVARDETYRYNAFNQLTTRTISTGYPNSTDETYSYDPQGAMTSKVAQITTSAGTTTEATAYSYNTDERLKAVTLPDGRQEGYAYDPAGFRVSVQRGATTRRYLLDTASVVASYSSGASPDETRVDYPGPASQPLKVLEGSKAYWPLTDALGSVYSVTGATGAVAATRSYGAFGVTAGVPANANVAQGFEGREHDAGTGLDYGRQRYLVPGLGRWTQPDALGFVDGPNRYVYVQDKPTTATDYSGFDLDTFDAWAVENPIQFIEWAKDMGIPGAGRFALRLLASVALLEEAGAAIRSEKCRARERNDEEGVYYRGLSWRDLDEYEISGVILSKGARHGLDLLSAMTAATKPGAAEEHALGHPSFSEWSPFVSTTKSIDKAFEFGASYDPDRVNTSGVIIRVESDRYTIKTYTYPDEQEYLFFFFIGPPDDLISRIYQ